MIIGFTAASSKPLSPRQLKALRQLLYSVREIHLGDCVYGDAEAHAEALRFGIRTIGHPPNDGRRRAFCVYDEERPPKPFLRRNRDIATEGVDGLIACPSGFVEKLRSGTWATVRYARKIGRRVQIIRPDGEIV